MDRRLSMQILNEFPVSFLNVQAASESVIAHGLARKKTGSLTRINAIWLRPEGFRVRSNVTHLGYHWLTKFQRGSPLTFRRILTQSYSKS